MHFKIRKNGRSVRVNVELDVDAGWEVSADASQATMENGNEVGWPGFSSRRDEFMVLRGHGSSLSKAAWDFVAKLMEITTPGSWKEGG
jgi:hypothetical protein